MRSRPLPDMIAPERRLLRARLPGALVVIAAASLAPAESANAACRVVSGEMNGAAGDTCEMLYPLRWENRRGRPMLHESIRLTTAPSLGRVSIDVQPRANRAAVSYRPAGKTAISDQFAVERCGSNPRGEVVCQEHRFTVTLSEQGAARAAETCLPRPFQMRTDRPVEVDLEGARGSTCLLRLFLAQEPVSISVTRQPEAGSLRISRGRVRYEPSFLTTSDRFQLEVCKRAEPGACSVLNVSVTLR